MKQSNSKTTLILSCCLFICLGISNSAIGPLLPELSRNAKINLASMGGVYTALFFGSILTQLISGTVIDKLGQKPVILIGIGMMVIGLGAYNFSLSYPLLLAFTFFAGLGLGAVVLGNNILIANVYPKQSVSALNLINFFYGVGAILGPAIVSLVITQIGSARWVVGLDSLAFLSLVPFFLRLKYPSINPVQNTSQNKNVLSIFTPLVWTLGIVTLLYVGIETGFSGWISTYINQTTSLSLETSALAASGFWFTFTLGRLVNTWLGLRFSAQRILTLNLCVAVFGSIFFTFSIGNQWFTILGVLIMGLAFGPIYPTIIAVANASSHDNPGQTVSIVASLGGAGGMLIPLLQGFLILNLGPLSNALLAVIILSTILVIMIRFQKTISSIQLKEPIETA